MKIILAFAALFGAGAATAIELPPLELTLPVDSDASVGATGSEPAGFLTIDGWTYFSATTPERGVELYRTDGTAGGLALVREFAPGPASSNVVPLGKAGGRLIVAADDGPHGLQLWSLVPDGTAVRLSAGTFGYPNSSYRPRTVGNAGGRLVVQNDVDGHLWSTDGTPAGTADLGRIGGSFEIADHCELGGALLLAGNMSGVSGFSAYDYSIVRTDGTAAGTATLGTVPHVVDWNLRVHGTADRCYFVGGGNTLGQYRGYTLMESDGTAAGTRIVASDANERFFGVANLGSTLYFARHDTTRLRLSRRKPGTDTFVTVAEIVGTIDERSGGSLVGIGPGLLGFQGPYASTSGTSLGYFVSDGTAAGTRRVWPTTNAPAYLGGYVRPVLGGAFVIAPSAKIYVDGLTGQAAAMPALGDGFYHDGATVGGVYVGAATDATGVELWRSDGTAAGTSRLADLWTSTRDGVAYQEGLAIGDVVYAVTPPTAQGVLFPPNTLMRTDGTPAGTRALPAGAHATGAIYYPMPFGDGIAFMAINPQGGSTLWYRADAALNGAVPIAGMPPVTSAPVAAGSQLLFGCGTATPFVENLCAADPASGQARVVYVGMQGVSALQPVGSLAGAAVFAAGDSIWRSDGTLPGTLRLAAAPGDTYDVDSRGLAFNGKIYFMACRVNAGACSLIATDGTSAGTVTIAALEGNLATVRMASLGDRFAFRTYGSTGFVQLWSSDGTAAGTQLLFGMQSRGDAFFAAVGGRAHLWVGCVTGCDDAYIVSDGTVAGTRRIVLPPTIVPVGSFAVGIGDAAIAFACRRAATGDEPCVIDRDGEHARLLADVFPGPRGSISGGSFVARNAAGVWLALNDGRHGTELWRLRELPDAIFANGFEQRVP
jgi:ELWxxDGT repeat protein